MTDTAALSTVATALQDIAESLGRLTNAVPPDRRHAFEDGLQRIRRARTELRLLLDAER
jgi:hypothetical protein